MLKRYNEKYDNKKYNVKKIWCILSKNMLIIMHFSKNSVD